MAAPTEPAELFVKDLELALLDGRIDFAVHSLKDVPSILPDGLIIAAVPPRGDPRDALVSAHGQTLAELPNGARAGLATRPLPTGSELLVMTIGMVVVAFMAAIVFGLNPVTIMSTPSRTRSAASTGSRSICPLA